MKGIIFDLDGTLLNSLEDIADAANYALNQEGLPPHKLDEYNYFVGNGLKVLIKRIVPEGTAESTILDCYNNFISQYKENWNRKSRPYKNITTMLATLQDNDIKLAVLSNKPDLCTRKVVTHYFGDYNFEYVAGQKEGVKKKPDPAGALEALKQLGLPREEVVFVGDSSVDMQTGKNCQLFTIGVSWGFRPISELIEYQADLIVNTPQEIIDYVLSPS